MTSITDEAIEAMELKPCPFCGETPDINHPATFQSNQGTKWGYVVCCGQGPEVRTGYAEAAAWRQDAIAAWNTRVPDPRVKALVEAARATVGRLQNASIDLMTGKTRPAVEHNLRDIIVDLRAALAAMEE